VDGRVNSNVTVTGGTLRGSGIINGSLTVNGVTTTGPRISPGNSAGTLTILGDLEVTNGVIELEVERGADGQLSFDQLVASSMRFLGNTTFLVLIGAGVIDGTASSFSFLTCGSGCLFEDTVRFLVEGCAGELAFGAQGLVLSVAAVPEPSSLVLLLAGMMMLVLASRRRLREA